MITANQSQLDDNIGNPPQMDDNTASQSPVRHHSQPVTGAL